MVTRNGNTIDLTVGTPRMLHKYIVAAFQHNVNGHLSTYLRSKGTWTSDEDPDWVTIRAFLVHKMNTTAQNNALLQYLCGTNGTQEWLHIHGWETDGRCSCGQAETL